MSVLILASWHQLFPSLFHIKLFLITETYLHAQNLFRRGFNLPMMCARWQNHLSTPVHGHVANKTSAPLCTCVCRQPYQLSKLSLSIKGCQFSFLHHGTSCFIVSSMACDAETGTLVSASVFYNFILLGYNQFKQLQLQPFSSLSSKIHGRMVFQKQERIYPRSLSVPHLVSCHSKPWTQHFKNKKNWIAASPPHDMPDQTHTPPPGWAQKFAKITCNLVSRSVCNKDSFRSYVRIHQTDLSYMANVFDLLQAWFLHAMYARRRAVSVFSDCNVGLVVDSHTIYIEETKSKTGITVHWPGGKSPKPHKVWFQEKKQSCKKTLKNRSSLKWILSTPNFWQKTSHRWGFS